jgi:hypothetical protein
VKEHHQHICLEHPDKSAVAEHCISQGHRIQLQDIRILSTKSRYMDQMIMKATEIELHPNNNKVNIPTTLRTLPGKKDCCVCNERTKLGKEKKIKNRMCKVQQRPSQTVLSRAHVF